MEIFGNASWNRVKIGLWCWLLGAEAESFELN